MAEVRQSFVVNRPVEEVFSFLTTIENAPLWQGWADEANMTSDEPVREGSTYRYVTRFLGRRFESQGVITAFEPNSRYGWKVTSGPIPASAETLFESVNSGTLVTLTAQVSPGGFFKLAEPLVMRLGRRQSEADAEKAKELLESAAVAPG